MYRAAMVALLLVAFQAWGQAFEKLMEKGQAAEVVGKTILAARRFEAAAAAATEREKRNDAKFAYISAVAGSLQPHAMSAEVAAEVERTYREIRADAAGEQAFKVHNDYGVFLLGRGRAGEAIDVFVAGETSFPSVSAKTQARYLYNFAEAYHDAGRFDDALAMTLRVIELDASLEPASAKAFRIIVRLPEDRRAAEAADVIELLLDQEQDELARKWLWEILDRAYARWHEQPAAARFAALCARWAASRGIEYGEFAGKWLPRMKAAADDASDEVEEKVEQLEKLFEGDDLPLSFEADLEPHFSRWATAEEQEMLSALAMVAAEAFLDRDELKRAAERYVAAWRLDPDNIDALIYLASIMTEWPDAPEDLLDRLLAAAFDRGGVAGADPDSRLRLHLVLGSLFEQREQWGPRDVPATATYQYERALEEYVKIFNGSPDAVFPGVHANLATAYSHLGMNREAFEQYLYAADGSLSQELREVAGQMLVLAESLDYTPTAEEAAHLVHIRKEVEAAQSEEPLTDADVAEAVRTQLWSHPEDVAEDLFVSVSAGVVSLSGSVDDRHLIEEATVTAQATRGVKDVNVENVREAAERPPDP